MTYASNALLATKVSFANAMANVGEAVGAAKVVWAAHGSWRASAWRRWASRSRPAPTTCGTLLRSRSSTGWCAPAPR
ncbi:MAG: hypothetical protein ACYDEN_05130 [Acidimicrobiales bacterium]